MLNNFKDTWTQYVDKVIFVSSVKNAYIRKAIDHVYCSMNLSSSESVSYLEQFADSVYADGNEIDGTLLLATLRQVIEIDKEQYEKTVPSAPPKEEEELPPPDYQEAIKPHTNLMQERDKAYSEIHILEAKLREMEEKQREAEKEIQRAEERKKYLEHDNKELRKTTRTNLGQIRQLKSMLDNGGRRLINDKGPQGHRLNDRIVGAPYQEWNGPGLL